MKKDFTGSAMHCAEGIELYVYEAIVQNDKRGKSEFFLTKQSALQWAKQFSFDEFEINGEDCNILIYRGETIVYHTIDNQVTSLVVPILNTKLKYKKGIKPDFYIISA